MQGTTHSVYWEAPEHTHIEKTSDWYWVLGIIAIAGSVTSIILGNVLLGILIPLAAVVMVLVSARHPRIIPFEVSLRGVRVADTLFPYATLESYYLDEENHIDPQLILKSKKLLAPLQVIPIPEEYITEIERLVSSKLPEEHLEEPFAHRLLEYLGF